MVDVLEVIAEPNRRKIMQLVWARQCSAGEIARQFDTTFGAVSQHLHVLRDAGLIEVQKAGRSRLYRARKESLGPLANALEAMWSEALDRLKSTIEKEAVCTADSARKRTLPQSGPRKSALRQRKPK